MSDFVDDEIYREIESFFLESLTDQNSNMSGSGMKYDMEVFAQIRKFINLLNEKYHTSLGVVDSKFQLKGVTQQQVEECFKQANHQAMDYGQIMKNVQVFVMFLNEMKFENQNTFDELRKKGIKFVKFLKGLYKQDVGKKQQSLIKQLEDKFKSFNDYLEFYTQQSLGFVQHQDLNDDVYDSSDELSSRLREMNKVMKQIKVVKKQGLSQLIDKYMEGLSKNHVSKKQWNALLKVIELFPLYIESDKLEPNDLRDLLVDLSTFILFDIEDEVKAEFLQKIKILFKKVEDKKMEGGRPHRVLQDQMKKEYKKKIIIEIFRYNVQQHYSSIINKFNDIIQQKYISQVNILSGNLRQITGDLRAIFNLLADNTYIGDDLAGFVNILRESDQEYVRQPQNGDALRFKFQYLKSQVDLIIEDAKSVNIDKSKGFSDDFIEHIKQISAEFQQLVNYIRTLERQDFDLSDQQLSVFQKETQHIDLTDIQEKINEMLDKIDGFINVSYLYNNIERTKKELATIDMSKYQDESIHMFIQAKNDMQKYYKELLAMYQKEDVVYDPTLAQYMKEILLKFHSCDYLSRGIFAHPTLNPRYNPFFYMFDGNVAAANAPPIDETRYPKIPHQLIGITEEMGARVFKNKNRYQLLTEVFDAPNFADSQNQFNQQIPLNPQLNILTDMYQEQFINIDMNSHIYTRMIKFYDIFDIIATRTINPAQTTGRIRQGIEGVHAHNVTFTLQQLNRLFHQENGLTLIANEFNMPKQAHLDSLLQHYTEQILRPGNNGQQVVTSYDNHTLREFLNPQIQIPFVQPFMKLRAVSLEEQQLNAYRNGEVCQIEEMDLIQRNGLYLDNYQYLENPIIHYRIQDAQVGLREININQEEIRVTNIFGVQLSVPQVHTPQGLFGTSHKLDVEEWDRFNRFLTLTNNRRWFNFYSHPIDPLTPYIHGGAIEGVLNDNGPLPVNQSPVFIPICNAAGCVNGVGGCYQLDCDVVTDKVNQSVQYHMYMAQQLQYFSIKNNYTIFDPMVRKKIFEITHTVYTGMPLLPGLDRKIKYLPHIGDNATLNDYNLSLANNDVTYEYLDAHNLYLLMSRPFGVGSIERSQQQQLFNGQLQRPLSDAPSRFYYVNKGLYEDIPEDFIEEQPRVAIAITLLKPQDSILRTQLIDACDRVNMHIIDNGILKVTKQSLEQLISIIDQHENGRRIRCYLSTCIQIQYHTNYQLMQHKGQIGDDIQLMTQVELDRQKIKFLDMAKKVINIKQIGNAALIVLTDIINISINEQVNQFQTKTKVDYKTIIEQLNSLIITYRQQDNNDTNRYFDDIREDVEIITTYNRYLNKYDHNTKTQANFYDNAHVISGGANPEHNNFWTYFAAMERYIDKIKTMVHRLPIVDNFASLFVLIANNESSGKEIHKDTIVRFIKEYIVSSMIDISESTLQFDFGVKLVIARTSLQGANGVVLRNTIKDTQLVVDTRANSSTSIISPDCIFIPVFAQNKDLVPQFTSQISRDFDQLFNQLINAMSQRMLNHIGLYRFTQKKVIDDTVQVSRIMLGIGRNRNKKRSRSLDGNLSQSVTSTRQGDNSMVVETRTEIPINKFDLYFRCYLIVKYYHNLFANINVQLRQQYMNMNNDPVKYFVYHFKPESNQPEGKLFQILSFLNRDNEPATLNQSVNDRAVINMNAEDLELFMKTVDRIAFKYELRSNDQIYQKLVSYVNQEFGIISNIDQDRLSTIADNNRDNANRMSLRDFLSNNEQPVHDVQVGDPRLRGLNNFIDRAEDEGKNVMYTNVQQIILNTINQINKVIEFKREAVNNADRNTIGKYLQNQHKLLKIRNATMDEYKNSLLYIINNIGENNMNDIQTPIMFHEQCLFATELYNAIQNAKKIKEEMEFMDPHKQLLYTRHDRPVQSAIIQENNKEVLMYFVDKLSDQYSIFAGSSLYSYTLSNQNLTIKRIIDNRHEDLPIAHGAGAGSGHVYRQNYQNFRSAIIIEDMTQLDKKLKSLATVIDSLMRNPRFEENRTNLYRHHNQIIQDAVIYVGPQEEQWQAQPVLPQAQSFIAAPGVVGPIPNILNANNNLNAEQLQQLKNNVKQIQRQMLQQSDVPSVRLLGRGNPYDNSKLTAESLVKLKSPGHIYAQDDLVYKYDIGQQQENIQQQSTPTPTKVTPSQKVIQHILYKGDVGKNDIMNITPTKWTGGSFTKYEFTTTIEELLQAKNTDSEKKKALYSSIIRNILTINSGNNQAVAFIQNAFNNEENVNIIIKSTGPKNPWIQDKDFDDNVRIEKGTELQVILEQTQGEQIRADFINRGSGLGVQADVNGLFPLIANTKLNLERAFFYQYNIYEGQLQQTDDVFVFNKILKSFFMGCRTLTSHHDLLAQLFNGCIQDARQHQSNYQLVHSRDPIKSKYSKKYVMRQLQTDTPRVGLPVAPPDTTFNINTVENPVTYLDMVNNILYDGYHEVLDQFTYLDIELHNKRQLDENLQNVSVFTSSIFNFFMYWQQQQEKSRTPPVDLMSLLNMRLNNEDLQILVSNAIFAKYQLRLLVDKLVFKQNILQHVAQQLFNNRNTQRWSIDNTPGMVIRQHVIKQQQFLRRIQNTIQHHVLPALDTVINNKHNVLPQVLQSGVAGAITQPLISNLFYIFDNKKVLQQLKFGNIQDDSDVFKLNYARYLYIAMTKQNNEVLVKQLSSGNEFDPVAKFHDLITMMIGHRFNLYHTILNTENWHCRSVQLVPTPNMLRMNPEQQRNIVTPIEMMKQFDGYTRPNPVGSNSLGITRYHNYLTQNLEYINQLAQSTFKGTLSLRAVQLVTRENTELSLEYRRFFDLIDPQEQYQHAGIIPAQAIANIYQHVIDQQTAFNGQHIQLYPFVYYKERLATHQGNYLRPQMPAGGVAVNLRFELPIFAGDQGSLIPNDYGRIPWDNNIDNNVLNNLYPIRIHNTRQLLYQNFRNYELQQSLPSTNPRIFEEIIRYLQIQNVSNNIELRNIIELGIMPLNLNMLKRESGLINIALYSNAFQQYLDRIQRQQVPAVHGAHPNGYQQAQYFGIFDINRLDLNLNNIQNRLAPFDANEMMRIPEFEIIQNILLNTRATALAVLPINQITMKFDHIRQSMQFRVALFLYIILTEMLGGVVHRDRDTYLHGIEALVSGQFQRPMIAKEAWGVYNIREQEHRMI